MAQRLSKILVFGATGLIGHHITNALLDSKDAFEQIGVFTSQSSIERKKDILDSFRAKGAAIITGDLQNEQDVSAAYKNYDTVIAPLGREAISLQPNLIRLAEESGTIIRFFPSEFGTDVEYSEASTHEQIHQPKIEVRHYFRDHVQRLEHTYLMTGPYADYYFGGPVPMVPQIGSFDAKAKKAYLLVPVDQQLAWTAMPDVGKFVVAALLHPDVSRNKALKVKSFVASHADVLVEFEKQTGGGWDVEHTSLAELAEVGNKAWEENKWYKGTCSLRKLWMRGETLYPEFDNDALGVKETMSLEQIVGAAVGVKEWKN